jgi:hypothetical protein
VQSNNVAEFAMLYTHKYDKKNDINLHVNSTHSFILFIPPVYTIDLELKLKSIINICEFNYPIEKYE